jgi:hypothetical protein
VWNTLDIVPEVPTFPFIHVSGLGDSIVRTEQQLATLLVAPPCEHGLKSYQWLLDASNFPLDLDCAAGAAPLTLTAESARAAKPTPQALGAQRLRRAMHGRA